MKTVMMLSALALFAFVGSAEAAGKLTYYCSAQEEWCQLMVNATSVGMAPQNQLSPWPEEVLIPAGTVVFDLVYAPLETKLLQQAKAAGAHAIDGLQMLIHQGIEAFRLWTGLSAPREVICQAALAAVCA